MKTKLLLTSLIFCLLTTTIYAQTVASTAGIAVQGIARDSNNTARINQNVSLTFLIYYLNGPNEATVLSQNVTVTTDSFGVFSHILNPAPDQNAVIANFNCNLRISEGQTVITDEALKAVPYAIAASNGVPTGSIMPFMGTTAPPGWVICDGQDFSSLPGSEALSALLGATNVPNLSGMFLRGAGTNQLTTETTTLGGVQDDGIGIHSHNQGNLRANNAGDHTHATTSEFNTSGTGQFCNSGCTGGAAFNQLTFISKTTSSSGNHGHTISGNTGDTGISETRPVNFGVNYIIKL